MSIVVRSLRKGAPPVPQGYTAVRCDRGGGSPLGNPFVLRNARDDQERAQVITKFHRWFDTHREEPPIANELHALATRVSNGEYLALMCWCHPKPCHLDHLALEIERLADAFKDPSPET